ncbi:30S ribosomal protein S20 [Barrientosiimonas marina]|uniref:Small ribosomal subunit protein bS20 n=1 Tax=Lentibacillus kimchii TaxID=1542911 RepID=A0ABW2UZR7_9BACI
MANIKSAKKRIDINEKNRIRNAEFKSEMRTYIKHLDKLIQQNDAEGAKEALPNTIKKIDKAVQHGGVHKNSGNREKSRLTKEINKLGA